MWSVVHITNFDQYIFRGRPEIWNTALISIAGMVAMLISRSMEIGTGGHFQNIKGLFTLGAPKFLASTKTHIF